MQGGSMLTHWLEFVGRHCPATASILPHQQGSPGAPASSKVAVSFRIRVKRSTSCASPLHRAGADVTEADGTRQP